MTATTEPTRAPGKALFLTDYARSTWDIAALCRPIDPGARRVGALPAPGPVALRVPHPIATDPVDPS
jgi:hypothetical protein